MLIALGPRLQRLSLCEGYRYHKQECLDDLIPAIVIHCPLLARLDVGHLGLGKAAAVSVMAIVLHQCDAMSCRKVQRMMRNSQGNDSCKCPSAYLRIKLSCLQWRPFSAQLQHCSQLRLSCAAQVSHRPL